MNNMNCVGACQCMRMHEAQLAPGLAGKHRFGLHWWCCCWQRWVLRQWRWGWRSFNTATATAATATTAVKAAPAAVAPIPAVAAVSPSDRLRRRFRVQ